MPEIKIKVRDKCAEGEGVVICNNSDYTVVWDLDNEWEPYSTRTMRVNLSDGTYQDVVFTGDNATLPVLTASGWVSVGLYAGDLHTSRAARLLALSSVLTPGGSPAAPAEDVYAQIMAKLNELSTVSPEDIAKAVEDYLSEHPIKETDPTVPEWAKAETKPTYSAAEVGAISQSNLQAATNVALAQAKASGEFDGPRGPAGTPGKDGAGMDITGATVGQIAKIAAVDASGKPTAWVPADMPSGGGDTWEKLYDGTIQIEQETMAIEVDMPRNDSAKEFQIYLHFTKNTAQAWDAAKEITVKVNGATFGYFIFKDKLASDFYIFANREFYSIGKLEFTTYPVSPYSNVTSPRIQLQKVSNGVQNNDGKISISFVSPYAGTIELLVYGRY